MRRTPPKPHLAGQFVGDGKMAKSLFEYAAWLDDRQLLWPAAPEPAPVKATPYLLPLPEIRAVTWGTYGTLLLISDGRLLPFVDDAMRMEVALEKTIQEFSMWNSMSRKPGAPWEYMLHQFKRLIEDQQMVGTGRKGEAPEVDLAHVWRVLIERLQQKEYEWDEEFLGDSADFSEKIAYFFQTSLQGLRAAPNALVALQCVHDAGLAQGLVGDGQAFTLVQLLRALHEQGDLSSLKKLFTGGCVSLSFDVGVRQPSESLFQECLDTLAEDGIAPDEVLHVAPRLKAELGPARKLGMKTALYTGDKRSFEATAAEVNDPDLRPDRILTDLRQIRQIVKRD